MSKEEIDQYEIRDAKLKPEIQGLLKKMSLAYGDFAGRGLLHLYECISMLKSQVGEEPLKKAWGKSYEEKSKKLRALSLKIGNLNFFFHQMDEAKIKREQDPTSQNFIRYRKMYSEVIQESDLLYDAFHILLQATKIIKHLSIPHEYWSQAVQDKTSTTQYNRGESH